MKLDNKTYDIWNKIQRWLPAIAVLYVALSQIWGSDVLPFADEINKTIMAICTFLASILEVSSVNFYKDEKEALNNNSTLEG